MPGRVKSYGGPIRSEIQLTGDDPDAVVQRRILWFDRDIDGRWMVWVSEDRGPGGIPEAEQPMEVGALIIDDRTVAAFLEQLGELLHDPDQFAHEPLVPSDPQP